MCWEQQNRLELRVIGLNVPMSVSDVNTFFDIHLFDERAKDFLSHVLKVLTLHRSHEIEPRSLFYLCYFYLCYIPRMRPQATSFFSLEGGYVCVSARCLC